MNILDRVKQLFSGAPEQPMAKNMPEHTLEENKTTSESTNDDLKEKKTQQETADAETEKKLNKR